MTANLPSQETETRDAGEVRAGFYRVRDALKADDREAMLAIVEEASAKLSKLCHGERWTMTIPVQDTDTDMVLGRAIDLAEKLIERTCKKDLQVPVLDRPSGDDRTLSESDRIAQLEARIYQLNRFVSAARRSYNRREPSILFDAITVLNDQNRTIAAGTPEGVRLIRSAESESLREVEETPVHTMIALRRAAYREHNASLAAAGPGVVITCDMCECGMHTGMFSSPLCALYATLLAARRASSSRTGSEPHA